MIDLNHTTQDFFAACLKDKEVPDTECKKGAIVLAYSTDPQYKDVCDRLCDDGKNNTIAQPPRALPDERLGSCECSFMKGLGCAGAVAGAGAAIAGITAASAGVATAEAIAATIGALGTCCPCAVKAFGGDCDADC